MLFELLNLGVRSPKQQQLASKLGPSLLSRGISPDLTYNNTPGNLVDIDGDGSFRYSGLLPQEKSTERKGAIEGGYSPGRVTKMKRMFNQATSFDGDLSNWDVSNVTNLGNMFRQASAFNKDISSWDVSNVTEGFSGMFYGTNALSDYIKLSLIHI